MKAPTFGCTKAGESFRRNGLGSRKEAQQKIRLAHVYRWKKEFEKGNSLFAEVISLCRRDQDANIDLDFALQHAEKNFFDQHKFERALDCFNEALMIRLRKRSPADQSNTEVERRLKEV